MIDSRQKLILQYLILYNNPIKIDEIAQYLQVSTRTIRNDISDINEMLSDDMAYIEHTRNEGYSLVIKNFESFNNLLYDLDSVSVRPDQLETADKRIKHLVIKLIYANDYISLDDLAESVYVSISTLLNYLKNIRELIEEYDLVLENKSNIGYKIKGEEKNKRTCLADLIAGDIAQQSVFFSQEQLSMFSEIDLEEIRSIINKHINNNVIKLSDMNQKYLILHFALMISRLKNNTPIGDFEIDDKDLRVNSLLNDILKDIENEYHLEIPAGERSFLYTHLIKKSSTKLEIINDAFVKKSVNGIIDYLNIRFGYDLRQDEILYNDFINHFTSVLAVKHYNLTTRNPMLTEIKKNFPFEFEVALMATNQVFSNTGISFSQDDTSYVALHLRASLERNYSNRKRKVNVILVCGSGVSTTRLVEARLENEFGNYIQIIKRISFSDYLENNLVYHDMIISTIPLPIKSVEKPYVYLRMPFEQSDFVYLRKLVDDFYSSKVISKYFDNDLYFSNSKVENKEDILRLLCKNLEMKNLVSEEFYDSVLKREGLASTLIYDGVAIPHPLDAYSKQTKIVVANLNKPVKWHDNLKAELILLLAISEEDKNEMNILYEIFIDLINNQNQLKKAKKADTLEQFLKLLTSSKTAN